MAICDPDREDGVEYPVSRTVDGVLLDRFQWGKAVMALFDGSGGRGRRRPLSMKDGEKRRWIG